MSSRASLTRHLPLAPSPNAFAASEVEVGSRAREGIGAGGTRRTLSRRHPATKTRRRGAAAVELALTLPLLMLIVIGACDYGRFGHAHTAVVNAARAGAGHGARYRPTPTTQGQWEAAIRRAVTDELSGVPAFDEEALATTSSLVAGDAESRPRVRVEVNYRFTTLVNWGVIPHETMLRETAVFPLL